MPWHDDLRRWRGHVGHRSATCSSADAERLVGQSIDAGINFIDTADIYSSGTSEEMVGQSLKTLGVRREDVVIATKVFGPMARARTTPAIPRPHLR